MLSIPTFLRNCRAFSQILKFKISKQNAINYTTFADTCKILTDNSALRHGKSCNTFIYPVIGKPHNP